MIYRLDIRYPASRGGRGTKFRLMITAQDGASIETVSTVFVADKPTFASLRVHLAERGFESYGDMAQLSDGTLRSMIRPKAA
jgi:hypothetical protein